MGLFNKGQSQTPLSERQKLQNRFGSARGTLLAVVLFTAINIVLLVTNSDSYFLFSAFVPYIVVNLAMLLCGKYPAEYYEGEIESLVFLDSSFLVVAVVIAAVMLVLYLLCWLFSKKPRVGWLIAGLVFFVLDTVLMALLGGGDFTTALDIFFHVWVLASLVSGIMAHYKLKKLPEEEVLPETPVEAVVSEEEI